MTEVLEYESPSLKSWAPDGQSLLVSFWNDAGGGQRDLLVHRESGEQVRLREAWWLSGDRLVAWDGSQLMVVDLHGQILHVIYRGQEITRMAVNPFTQVVAFLAIENGQYYLHVRAAYPEG